MASRNGCRTRLAPCVLALAMVLMLAGPPPVAYAGGSPENAVIIIDPRRPESLYIGNYYRNARNIPDRNVLYFEPLPASFAQFAEVHIPGLLGELHGRRTSPHVDYVVIMPTINFFFDAPGLVTWTCSPISRFSFSGAYSMAFITDEVLAGTTQSNANRYFQTTNDPNQTRFFSSNIKYASGQPSSASTARRYFIGAMIGYAGPNGNTLQEIKDMIDRSVAVDGTHPSGTFYFMNNTADPPRNVRAAQYAGVLTPLTGPLGASATQIVGALPAGQQNCLGILTGFSDADIAGAGMNILPGAFCDHLTSFAATFDISAQTKASQWIRNGASGSYGTVQEPCNFTQKFPHTRAHMFYWQGLSLGEAVFRSLAWVPFQGLLLGDPLTRPFAYLPDVIVPDAPLAPVSGVIVLNPVATTAHPSAGISNLALHVDNRRIASQQPGVPFVIDTTTLSDGWHDLRVLAFEATNIRSTGRWVGELVVNNTGRAASVSVNTHSGNLNTPFTFTVSGTGAGVVEIRLVQNGRVLAAAPGSAAQFTIFGTTLGAGPVRVHAEALLAGGKRVRSAPLDLQIDFSDSGNGQNPPVAFSYTRYVSARKPSLVELPSTYENLAFGPNYEVVSSPAQASLPAGQFGPHRVLVPNPGASGTDSFTFRANSGVGLSNVATVNLVYTDCADIDGDFIIGQQDLGAMLAAFGTCVGNGAYNPDADLDDDGCVGQMDLGILLAGFGTICD